MVDNQRSIGIIQVGTDKILRFFFTNQISQSDGVVLIFRENFVLI